MARRPDKGRAGRALREFNFLSFVLRFVSSTVLVIATYNPSDYSFWAWVASARVTGTLGPGHFVVGHLGRTGLRFCPANRWLELVACLAKAHWPVRSG